MDYVRFATCLTLGKTWSALYNQRLLALAFGPQSEEIQRLNPLTTMMYPRGHARLGRRTGQQSVVPAHDPMFGHVVALPHNVFPALIQHRQVDIGDATTRRLYLLRGAKTRRGAHKPFNLG